MADYFLGESTQNGLKTYFNTQIMKNGRYTYILKGGAGTGKSTLMKRIAEELSYSDEVDRYFCASDPSSLDAVVLNKRNIAVVDGTSPHVFDPYYPGLRQSIINMGEFWDSQKLRENEEEIIKATDDNLECHKRCRRYLTALSSINSDIYSIASGAVRLEKLMGFTGRLTKKIIPDKKTTAGISEYRQFSAVTSEGFKTHCTEGMYVYLLNDENFAGADIFLRKLEENAIERGYDVIVGECALFRSPIYEHLIIPELKTAFSASNKMNNLYSGFNSKINFSRFYAEDKIKARKARLDFSKKASKELLNECASTLCNAKSIHDKIESYYITSVDFKKIDKLTKKLIDIIS